MRRLDYSFVKSSIESEGYRLLSKEYVNNTSKLLYICPNGHRHLTSWRNWCIGNRCSYCSGKVKKSIGFIKAEFENEGYTLLSNTYKNAFTKLKYKCPLGHKHNINWNNWCTGYRCYYCNGSFKPDINFIRSEFEKENYKLLSNEYKDNKTKLKYVCPEGHKHSINWNKWQMSRRCPTCAYIKKSGPGHPNWKGGISCEPYCDVWLDQEFKESIKERDGHRCQNPYCFKKKGKAAKLAIHHVDYNKKNCRPNNLITLCISCNFMANKDRKWHTSWYRAIMNKKYKYNY